MDGTYATVVMNQTDEPIVYRLFVYDQKIEMSIPARAMQTIVY